MITYLLKTSTAIVYSSSPKKWYMFWDFPGGPVVKNPPSNAGDAGLILGRGTKIPQAAGQLL